MNLNSACTLQQLVSPPNGGTLIILSNRPHIPGTSSASSPETRDRRGRRSETCLDIGASFATSLRVRRRWISIRCIANHPYDFFTRITHSCASIGFSRLLSSFYDFRGIIFSRRARAYLEVWESKREVLESAMQRSDSSKLDVLLPASTSGRRNLGVYDKLSLPPCAWNLITKRLGSRRREPRTLRKRALSSRKLRYANSTSYSARPWSGARHPNACLRELSSSCCSFVRAWHPWRIGSRGGRESRPKVERSARARARKTSLPIKWPFRCHSSRRDQPSLLASLLAFRESGFIYLTAIRTIGDCVVKGVGRSRINATIRVLVSKFFSSRNAFETQKQCLL